MDKETQPNSIEELTILDRAYWIEKAKTGFKELYDKKTKQFITKPYIFEYAPETIKNDKEIVMLALTKGKEYFYRIELSLRSDKQFVLELIDNNSFYGEFISLSQDLVDDIDIFLAASKKSSYSYRRGKTEYRKNKEFVLDIAKINFEILEYLPRELKDDPEIYLTALKHNFQAVKLINKNMLSKIITVNKNKDGVYAGDILDADIGFLNYMNSKVLNNVKLMEKYIMPYNLPIMGKKVLDNEELMLKVSNYEVSKYFSDRLKSDEDFMLKSIKKNYRNIRSISSSLIHSKSFCIKAIEADVNTYAFFDDEMRNDCFVIQQLFKTKEYSYAIGFIPAQRLKNLTQCARENNTTILELIDKECLMNVLDDNLEKKSSAVKKLKL